MADNLYFSRNTRVAMQIDNDSWEIPVLDGFSFSQATNASEITLNEFESSAGNSRRGKRMFNNSFAPAEWSFQTYVRPFIGGDGATGAANLTDGKWDGVAGKHHAVEEALWAAFVAKGINLTRGSRTDGSETAGAWSDTTAVNNTGDLSIAFTNSNKSNLTEFDLFFMLGSGTYDEGTHTVYKIEGCVVNEASIDFDIEGIATISWSGFGKVITEVNGGANLTAANKVFNGSVLITEAIGATNNFIRNRLTTLDVTNSGGGTNTAGLSAAYNLTLTGGSVTFSNNITYITPENLGVVNKPLGHVTGSRNINGSFTCYLSNSTNAGADLFEDLLEMTTSNMASLVTPQVQLVFTIGGASAPNLKLDLPVCHLEFPTHSIDDIISLETNFHALPSTLDGADEAALTYTGIAVS